MELSSGNSTQLPEDDGMFILRSKIHAIRDRDVSTTQKAHLIHSLMTETYNSLRSERRNHILETPEFSPNALERPPTPLFPLNWSSHDPDSVDVLPEDSATSFTHHFNLTPNDLEPTFVPPQAVSGNPEDTTQVLDDNAVGNEDYSEEDEHILGCQHYRRNVKLQCFTCKKWYTCRFCHDEVEDHSLERRRTENMLCMLCGSPQPAAQSCRECGTRAASYFCGICKLWDNDTAKSIYHCNDCGICRIGKGLGKDFFHCKTCGVCMPISIESTHRCIENSTQCNCPICGDYMFTSPDTVVFMRCGHSIHHKCYDQFSKTSYRCPICSKSITNMESRFRNLDRTIESQPMPAEFRDTKAFIYCNDCSTKSAVSYHWLGLKCELCESYNTVQIRLLREGENENADGNLDHETLARPRPSSAEMDDFRFAMESSQMEARSIPTLPSARGSSLDSRSPRESRDLHSHSRAVSPTVSNYFGLAREPPSTGPANIFARVSKHSSGETGSLGFWRGRSLSYNYSFFGASSDHSDHSDHNSGAESEIIEASSDDLVDDDEEEDEDVEEDDDDEEVDIFEILGHP